MVGIFAPIILLNAPKGDKIAPFIPQIVNGIIEAEQIPGATGAQKKDHVMKIVKTGAVIANATGKVNLDPDEIAGITSKGIDLTIDVMHAANGAKVTKGSPTINPTGE